MYRKYLLRTLAVTAGLIQLSCVFGLDFETASVKFCNTLTMNGENAPMKIQVGEGDDTVTFIAGSECCTECMPVVPGDPVPIMFWRKIQGKWDLVKDNGQAVFEVGHSYLIRTDPPTSGNGNLPVIGYEDFERYPYSCEDYLLDNHKHCGTVE